jgi:subtilisin family serine protease
VASGITWAADNGATVINLSLGSPSASPAIQLAIQDAVSQGVTVVAAAGNTDTCPSTCYPGAFPEVLAVAATTQANGVASFSTQGSFVDIAAPGVAIDSTWNNGGYNTISGTSMASPHVAGSAALVRATGCSQTQTDARLRNTALDIPPPGPDGGTGNGLVRPDQAVLSCT